MTNADRPEVTAAADRSAARVPPPASVPRAFWVLVALSFQRHWRVRQMGWVAVGLLAIVVIWAGALTVRPGGWGMPDRSLRRGMSYRQYAEAVRPGNRLLSPTIRDDLRPNLFDPLQYNLQALILYVPAAVVQSERFVADWAFMNFSRWVVSGAYLGFVLPMFTLAYASGAIGTDRETRALVWLMTRPMPRAAIYLAKFVGTLPWCLLFSVGGFAALCLAGGELGRAALGLYWPAAVAGTVAFSALFHLIGAVFRRPVVVGLVYAFFFEFLVAGLPGSLKLLSLTFYARCLMYNGATTAGYPGDMLEVAQPVSAAAAWAVLAAVTVGFTGLGMWLFARTEYRDDV
ncbi:MAG: family transporter protein [Gemmataceae bacterium]|nr:family transporter protein [Gemmataceae bacterium]